MPHHRARFCVFGICFFFFTRKKAFVYCLLCHTSRELRIAKFLNQYYVIKSIGGVAFFLLFDKIIIKFIQSQEK